MKDSFNLISHIILWAHQLILNHSGEKLIVPESQYRASGYTYTKRFLLAANASTRNIKKYQISIPFVLSEIISITNLSLKPIICSMLHGDIFLGASHHSVLGIPHHQLLLPSGFAIPFIIFFQVELHNQVICYHCHRLLIKIEVFRQQVEDSLFKLTSQVIKYTFIIQIMWHYYNDFYKYIWNKIYKLF